MAAQDYEQVTYNGPAGAQVGSASTELVGFWGVTPVTLGTSVATATASATLTNIYYQFNLLLAELQRKGLVA